MGVYERKSIIGLTLSIFIILLGFSLYRYILLKNNECTYAIYLGPEGSATTIEYKIKFKTLSGKEIKTGINFNRQLKIGDTIWIKYSLDDPKVAELVDINYLKYMKK